jgi:AcrR family transcriptional regulator
MSSHSTSAPPSGRRAPRQQRGEERVNLLLQAAADVFAEAGYEAATMTQIAARSGSSIGAVYQYFPNKEALARALRTRYADEMAARWAALADTGAALRIALLAQQVVTLMTRFLEEHPAYFVLLAAPVAYERDADARKRLRTAFAGLLRAHADWLDAQEAQRIATVALQIVKSMNPLYAAASAAERRLLADEFTQALAAYLKTRLKRPS